MRGEVRAGRRKGFYGTTSLLWMDHLNPGGSRGAAGAGGAGHNLAKLSQDSPLAVWGAEEMEVNGDKWSFSHSLTL